MPTVEADILILLPFRFRFPSVMRESRVVIPSVFCQVSCYASVTLPLSFRFASVMRVNVQIQVINESWACLSCGPNNPKFVAADGCPKSAPGPRRAFPSVNASVPLPLSFRSEWGYGLGTGGLLGPATPCTQNIHTYTYNPTTNNEAFGNARPLVPFV